MRAAVMCTISDFTTYGVLSGWSTEGRLSCPYCMEKTKSFELMHGKKYSFFDCHRQFLPKDHPFRKNKSDFRKNRAETDAPPKRRNGEEVLQMVQQLPNIQLGTEETIYGYGYLHNWTKKSIFWELPYWSTHLAPHNLDVMQCEKRFFNNINFTVLDDPKKTKDNTKSRKDLELVTNRKELFLRGDNIKRALKQKAIYTLNVDQKKELLEWLKKIEFPDGYTTNISNCVDMEELQLRGLTGHDCHVFIQRLLPIAFRDYLPENVWGPLAKVSNFFRYICASEIRPSDMEFLQESIVETICKLEKFFPPSFFDSMIHMATHLPYEAKVVGPVQYRSVYPFRRRMHGLRKVIESKNCLERSISEEYLTSEIKLFRSNFMDGDIETASNRVTMNLVVRDVEMDRQLPIFRSNGQPVGKVLRTRPLSNEEYKAAELYLLAKCEDCDRLFGLFYEKIGGENLSDAEFNEKKLNDFVPWFKQNFFNGTCNVDPRLEVLAHGPLWSIKVYESYFSNGFLFHAKAYDKLNKTNNSGVCVKINEAKYYGVLQEVFELEFCGSGKRKSIFLFKCDWYNIEQMEIHPKLGLSDIKSELFSTKEPFMLANEAIQVYYTPYPLNPGLLAICPVKPNLLIDTPFIEKELEDDRVLEMYQDSDLPAIDPVTFQVEPTTYNEPMKLAGSEFEFVDCDNDEAVEEGCESEEDMEFFVPEVEEEDSDWGYDDESD